MRTVFLWTGHQQNNQEKTKVQIIKNQRKIVHILLFISLNFALCAQKKRLIETVLLSTHNICFD